MPSSLAIDPVAPPVPGKPLFRWPGVLLAGFCLAAAGACFDYELAYPFIEIQKYHTWFCYGFFALLLCADREGETRRRGWLTAAVVGGTFVLAGVMHGWVAELPLREELRGDQVAELVTFSPAPYLWAMAVWLASPLLLGGGSGRRYSRPLRVTAWALVIYGALCFGSAAASQYPERSLSLFYHERPLPFALLFAWLRFVHDAPAARARTARFVGWLLLALLLLGTLVGVADQFGPAPLRAALVEMNDEEHKLVYLETAPQSDNSPPVRRLQYPMLHFNRTAYLALVAAMVFGLARFPRRRSWESRWSLLGLAPAFYVMVQSATRGVTAAAVAALCAWAALVSRRALALILVLCVGVVVALPAPRRAHYLSIFNPATYRVERGAMTSIGLRILGWQYGLGVIGRMPLTGLGYGTQVVRRDYEEYIKNSGNRRLIHDLKQNTTHQHMHNLWLEVAVESGLPALVAFMIFTGVRWWMLARAFRRWRGPLRRRLAAWAAFELALLIAGTIYYMLKHNFGAINFFVWAFMISELDALGREETTQE